ncbi:hypothetical protein ABN09_10670, partial [Morganella morganii]
SGDIKPVFLLFQSESAFINVPCSKHGTFFYRDHANTMPCAFKIIKTLFPPVNNRKTAISL